MNNFPRIFKGSFVKNIINFVKKDNILLPKGQNDITVMWFDEMLRYSVLQASLICLNDSI